MRRLSASACRFKRTKLTPWERGIAITPDHSSSVEVIVDMLGVPVPAPIFDYNLNEYDGCFNLDVGETK